MDVERYPLPRPQGLFATLAGGQQFTKLNLSTAYLQLLLENASRQYTMVNTHQGLYQYTRLPFGVSSAPALFQKVMDTILQGILNTICYIDNILVTGASHQEHLQDLDQVFLHLREHGIRLKKNKCAFMQTSVEFLGHRVDAEGLHPLMEKLQAVLKAPKRIRMFMSCELSLVLSLYSNFIPNLFSLLCPSISCCRRARDGVGQPGFPDGQRAGNLFSTP